MDLKYFSPEMPEDNKKKKDDKSLISREKLMENAKEKAQKIEQSKDNELISKNEGQLLTNDGREILSENK